MKCLLEAAPLTQTFRLTGLPAAPTPPGATGTGLGGRIRDAVSASFCCSHPDVASLRPDITKLITRLTALSEPPSDRFADTISNRIWLAAAVPEGEQSSHLAHDLHATLESDSDTRRFLAARLRRLSARLGDVGAQLAFDTAAAYPR